jgi:hypothetical protein
MALQVIGAGFGRTGTMSLKLAIEALGIGRCHHMAEIFRNAERQVPLWVAAQRGLANWPAIYDGYAGACDWPSVFYWRELIAAYPRAKVILTTRSAESWYESFSTTALSFMAAPEKLPPSVRTILEIGRGASTFGSGQPSRDHAIAVFNAHEAEVKQAVPPARLLIFNPQEGWAPICRFLGKPVPSTSFPRVNGREDFGGEDFWNFLESGKV